MKKMRIQTAVIKIGKWEMEDVVDKNQIFETRTENNNPDTRMINEAGL